MVVSFVEFRKQKFNEQRKKNLDELYKQIKNNNIDDTHRKKLKHHYERYKSFLSNCRIKTYKQFLKELMNNKLLLCGLEIEPNRQLLDEQLQIEYYNKKFNHNIMRLRTSGKASICFDCTDRQNIILNNSWKLKKSNRSKTFDCYDSKTKTYYTLKHTENCGGAQDNQINDVIETLRCCKEYNIQHKNEQIKFKAILSGTYMETHLDEIKKFKTDNIKIIFLH